MKKLKLLLGILITISFLSCSSDDNNSSDQDLIIGIWKPIKSVDVYNNGTEDTYNYSSCEQSSRYTFESDGTIDIISFDEYDNGECLQDNEGFELVTGKWEKIGENKYKFVTTYYYSDTQQEETETDIPDEISFPDSNTMRIRFDDGYEYNGLVLEYYYTEFSRI